MKRVMVAAVISGVVVLAFVLLAAAAGFLAVTVIDRRSGAVRRQATFLDGLGRINSRVRRRVR